MKNKRLEEIGLYLKSKGNLKQEVYQKTLNTFDSLKEVLKVYTEELSSVICKNALFDVEYKENGKFEAEIKFGGDVLIFNMHTNVFSFPDDFYVNATDYVKEDETRKFCGMIEVYNFLADSFKYSRYNDSGFLIARIFINKDGHFFLEGEEQLGFLYKDFDNLVMNDDFLGLIIEQSILYSLNFDAWAPKYHEVRELTVGQKLQKTASLSIKTSKRLGFTLSNETRRD